MGETRRRPLAAILPVMSAWRNHVISHPMASPASLHPSSTRTSHSQFEQFGLKSASAARYNIGLGNQAGAHLDNAAYKPAFELSPTSLAPPTTELKLRKRQIQPTTKMAEPRARVARHKGQMNFSSERT